jgi:hypothetical protein
MKISLILIVLQIFILNEISAQKNSVFIGLGLTNQNQVIDLKYQLGFSHKLTLKNNFYLNNELSYNIIPITNIRFYSPTTRVSYPQQRVNFNYFTFALIPEFKFQNNSLIGVGPSLSWMIPSLNPSYNSQTAYPYMSGDYLRNISVGLNSYAGYSFKKIVFKLRYNLNSISIFELRDFKGFNIEIPF